MKARGVGDIIVKVGGWGASVVTSSDRDWVSRVRSAGMLFGIKWRGVEQKDVRKEVKGGSERTNGRSLVGSWVLLHAWLGKGRKNNSEVSRCCVLVFFLFR